MTRTQALQSKIDEAKTALETALFTGGDTAQLRATLAELETELTKAERAAADAARAHQQAEVERVDQLVAEAVDAAQGELVAAAGAAEVAGVQMPTPDADPAIEAAAARVAVARSRLEREQAIYLEHAGKVSALRSRLTGKARVRDEILARRRSGDEQPGDAAEIALLAEDVASLNQLVEAAERIADQHKPTAAQRLVAEAESGLSAAQRGAVFRAKQARLQALEEAFLQAHAEMVEAANAVGANRFAAWKATQPMRVAVYGTGAF